jgi:hypothetical protein
VQDLPPYAQDRISRGIVADTRSEAQQIVSNLRRQAEECRTPTTTTPTPSAPVTEGTTEEAPSSTVTPSIAVDCEGLVP